MATARVYAGKSVDVYHLTGVDTQNCHGCAINGGSFSTVTEATLKEDGGPSCDGCRPRQIDKPSYVPVNMVGGSFMSPPFAQLAVPAGSEVEEKSIQGAGRALCILTTQCGRTIAYQSIV